MSVLTPVGIGVLDRSRVAMPVLYSANTTIATAAMIVYYAIALWIPAVGARSPSDLASQPRRRASPGLLGAGTWSGRGGTDFYAREAQTGDGER